MSIHIENFLEFKNKIMDSRWLKGVGSTTGTSANAKMITIMVSMEKNSNDIPLITIS